MGHLAENPEARALLSHAQSADFSPNRRRLLATVAAAAAAGVGAVWAAPRLFAESRDYRSGKGERRNLVLDDGSTLALNTDSQVRTRFSPTERCLFLERGQCFVRVEKNPRRPFRVFAGGHEIRALGTAFDVYSDGERTEVILEEGSVGIFSATGSTAEFPIYEELVGAALDSHASAILTPGKRATIITAQNIEIEDVDVKQAEAWQDGRLIFDDTPLNIAIREVNRYVARPLILEAPSLGNLRLSGVFQTNHLDRFAQALTENFGLRIDERNGVTGLQAP